MKKPETSIATRITVSFLLLFGLVVASAIIAVFLDDTEDIGANTAIIRIIGPITGDADGSVFAEGSASSTEIVDELRRARDDDSITAVILEINSPGGSAVASDEIGQAVKDVRAMNKTVVAWIRESGASGAYWIASGSDHIVANRMSITGSIGVIGSYMEFDEFLDDWNVSYNRLVAGDRKDIGDPFRDLSDADQAFIQHKLNRIHQYFIAEVAENRNMSASDVAKLATGEFMLGIEAYDAGLVDELGGEAEAIRYLEEATGETITTVVYEPEGTWLDDLLGIRLGARKPVIAMPEQGLRMESGTNVPQLR
jgi:protease-4